MTIDGAHALVLTTAPALRALSPEVVESVIGALPPRALLGHRWLSEGIAWEATLAALPASARLRSDVEALLLGMPIDVNIVPGTAKVRRKKLLISDMDSTVIEQECIDEMADMLGLKPRIAAITERAMRGELDFEAALSERLALLVGLPETDLARVLSDRTTLMPGVRMLTETMRRSGASAVLVSGGFTYFTAHVAERAGFTSHHANQLGMEGGRLTGRVVGPILGREAKLETLLRYSRDLSLEPSETLAVGDGANDLAMIRAAGLGVAYRAKPLVAAEAAASITHGDLTALLFLQGYTASEFATPA